MSNPFLVEDSDSISVSPILSQTIQELDDNADKYDFLMAVFIAIMAENGYRVSCLYDANNEYEQ